MSSTDDINNSKELVCFICDVLLGSVMCFMAVNARNCLKPVYYMIDRISEAEEVPVSDLRSLISSGSGKSWSESSKKVSILVRGVVTKLHTSNDSTCDALVSEATKQKCVMLEQTWGSIPSGQRRTTIRSHPFVLSGSGQEEHSSQVLVNLKGSKYSLPPQLTVVFDPHNKRIPNTIPCPIRSRYRPEFLVQEKILPVGKEITAVGTCSIQDGNLQIEACFLSRWTKDELMSRLLEKRDLYEFEYFCVGFFSVLLLGGCVIKGVQLWKKRRKEKVN